MKTAVRAGTHCPRFQHFRMAGRTLAGRRNLDNERALSEGSQLDPVDSYVP
jgi:hypothetical protein